MSTATLLPLPRFVAFDANGEPLAGGFVYTYVPGGTTPKTTWQDAAETTPNANPIILDADGSCLLYGSGVYQITTTDSLSNAVPTYSGLSTDIFSLISNATAIGFPAIANIAALRAATTATLSSTQGYVLGYYTAADGGEGPFSYVSSDTTSADNGGTIIVDASNRRWYRETGGAPWSVKWFGAKGDGTTDDAAAIQATITAVGFGGRVDVPPVASSYIIKASINVPALVDGISGIQFTGSRSGSVISPGATMAQMFNVTGQEVSITEIGLTNASGFAANGINVNATAIPANISARISNCSIIGFGATPLDAGIVGTKVQMIISGNEFINNDTDMLLTDGQGTIITGNYSIGARVPIHIRLGAGDDPGTLTPQGFQITNNTMLPNQNNGAGIQIDNGLEFYIAGNIIDCYGSDSVALQMISGGGALAIAAMHIIGNWIAGGAGSYSVFAAGNTADIDLISNTIIPNNGNTYLGGIALNGTNGYSIISNNFLTMPGVPPELNLAGVANGTIFANKSSNAGGNSTLNTAGNLAISGDFGVSAPVFTLASGATISSNTADPTGLVQPAGSFYARTPGALGARLYISQGGGTWLAVPGV